MSPGKRTEKGTDGRVRTADRGQSKQCVKCSRTVLIRQTDGERGRDQWVSALGFSLADILYTLLLIRDLSNTDRQAGRQANRQTDKQTERQRDSLIDIAIVIGYRHRNRDRDNAQHDCQHCLAAATKTTWTTAWATAIARATALGGRVAVGLAGSGLV